MQVPVSTLVVLSFCTLFLYEITHTDAAPARQRRALMDPEFTAEILEELAAELRREGASQVDKRRIDSGYGTRYGVASSVGSKLMALKQAADWNGPGRKRRDAAEEQ